MRILIVTSGLSLGGAERQIVLLAKELVRLGHAVCIYTLNRGGANAARLDELAGAGVDLVTDQKRLRLDFGVLYRLRRHIGTWRPDIVHGFLFDGDFYSRLAAVGTSIPVLNSERSDNYHLSVLQTIGYWLTNSFHAGVVANTYAGAEFRLNLHRMKPESVHVVWNGIDENEIKTRLERSTEPAKGIFPGDDIKRLCIVGAIKPEKDYILALRVMRQLVDSDDSWRLLCIGDKLAGVGLEYKQRVMGEYQRLALEKFVQFLGHRRDVPELVASSDLLMVTSAYEGFPNVVLEAMACGTAVVSTDYSDIRRILPDPAQVINSRDPRLIAESIERCYKNRDTLAEAQVQWVRSHCAISTSAAALIDVYAKYARSVAVAQYCE